MKKIIVPNLNYIGAIKLSNMIDSLKLFKYDEIVFDFGRMSNFDPFAMLVSSNKIYQLKDRIKIRYENIKKHSYAKNMGFFKECGFYNCSPSYKLKGSSTYQPITYKNFNTLHNYHYSVEKAIEKYSEKLAKVLSQKNEEFYKISNYLITEIIRNTYEHSKSENFLYAAQYWDQYKLVEISILDNGEGIEKSLPYIIKEKFKIKTNNDAIKLSLEPSISRNMYQENKNYYDNSGFGLYMSYKLCNYFNGSFSIASGDKFLNIKDNEIETHDVNLNGTAIRMMVDIQSIKNFKSIFEKIKKEGDIRAKEFNSKFIETDSKSRYFK